MTTPDPSLSTTVAPQRASIGDHLGVHFDAVAWAPDAADVDLSVACMFEHEAGGAALVGGLAHLDAALGGYLFRTRAEGRFPARELDTLLVSRPPAGVRARAVLVIGLGDPDAFGATTLERACGLAMANALRLGVASAAFAPNMLDAGLVPPPDLRAGHAMLRGAIAALALADHMRLAGLGTPPALRAWSFDVGPAHFAAATREFEVAFATLSNLGGGVPSSPRGPGR